MWEKILLKSISKHAKKLIDEVIDSEPRSANEILERMYNEIEKRRKEDLRQNRNTGRTTIPTRGELQMYLNSNYNSARFSKTTGKRAKSKGGGKNEARYWK